MNHHITISLPALNLTACRQPLCLPAAWLPDLPLDCLPVAILWQAWMPVPATIKPACVLSACLPATCMLVCTTNLSACRKLICLLTDYLPACHQPTIWLSYISVRGLENETELTMKFSSARISLYTLRILFWSIMYLSIYYDASRQAVIFLIKLSSKFSPDRKMESVIK
jgi:hypothetical protein